MDGDGEDRHSLVARATAHAKERDAALDRDTARRRGVVHTPGAIARFVARAADDALRGALGVSRGLADDGVVIVDPATGPGIFLAAVIEHAGARGAPRACVGLDVDAAAIARAEEVLAPAAREHGWALRLTCADALASLAPCAELEDDDVTRVVIGNPPWAARTANRDAALTEALLDDFRRDAEGVRIAERRIGVLSDDYVRFFRWGAEMVRRARRGGVLALVTNASFLDGPVHRAMRAALARWMDRVDVIDLGGSSLVARARGADENVFGVRPAVAITIAVRHPRVAAPGPRALTGAGQQMLSLGGDARSRGRGGAATEDDDVRAGLLRVATLAGTRDEKLRALAAAELSLEPQPIDRPWRRAGVRPPEAYARWPSLAEWMPFHREGLQTNRDELAIDVDRDALIAKLERFADGAELARASDHWDPARARRAVRALLDDREALDRAVRPIAYRPLDERFVVADPSICHRPRGELARAMDASGLALISARKDRGQLAWRLFGACAAVPDNCWLSTRSSCRARAFPLRDPAGAPNLDPSLVARAEDAVGRALDPETFAAWAVGWMASDAYRRACDSALREDYPRIPPPRAADELDAIAAYGRALMAALTCPADGSPIAATDVWIGHHRLRGDAARHARLAEALGAADAAISPRACERLGIVRR